ncbi:hypothetical protein QCN27_09000 [Cereibacter sp. SYSU M97828]|nr:hypothetical protein [Cereibacter flavus]
MTYSDQPGAYPSDRADTADDIGKTARHEYQDAKDRLSHQADKLRREGGQNIRSLVTDELDRRRSGFGSEIRNLADTLRHAADEQQEKAETGAGAAPSSLLRQGAGVLESLSDGLESRSVEDLARSVSDYARANPAIFIGGCVLAGIAVGRLVTASNNPAPRYADYSAPQVREPGVEPPIYGTPSTTARDEAGRPLTGAFDGNS